MRETGVIVSEEKNQVTVQIVRGDKCKNCNLCDATGPNQMQLFAHNSMGAKIGDMVEVEIPPGKVLGYSFIIFIIPIIMMITGYFIGVQASGGSEGAGIISSLVSLGLSFLVVKFFDSQLGHGEQSATVINIVS
jgi:sigma-E factor negative regulatory protein RseC